MPNPERRSLDSRWSRLSERLSHGLGAAVMLALVLGLTVPAMATLFVEHSRSEKLARAELERDLQRSTEVLALAMQSPLWELAQENAEGVVRAMSADERFDSVIVYDKVNKRPFVEIYRRAGISEQGVVAERNIEQGGAVIGRVIVSMSLEPYLKASSQAQNWVMLRMLLTLAVSMVLIFIVLRKRLLRPIATLTEGANRLAHEDFSRPIVLGDKSELGQVARALEQMRSALNRAFAELRSKNEELTQHAALLEDRVVERTEEVSRTNVELRVALETLQTAQDGLIESEKLASLGRLVAGVAHELNTPLGNALTVVSTLEQHYGSLANSVESGSLRRSELLSLVQATREGQEILSRNIGRAVDLIRDFKQLAVDQTSEMRRHFDLAKVLREVLFTLQPQLKHTALRLDVMLVDDVRMDSFPGPLGQVLTNLVFNALLHAFDGREPGRIRIETSLPEAGWVRICVTDDGHGMSADVRRNIFDPFFTTKLGQGGSGLGLHIVHNIVTKLLGGRIEVFSNPGEGARFEITLPQVAPESTRE